MNGYAIGAAIKGFTRLAFKQVRPVSLQTSGRDVRRIADDHIDRAFEIIAFEGGEEITLPDGDTCAGLEPVDVAARQRNGAVREVGAPDAGRRDVVGDTECEISRAAAHVDDGRCRRAIREDRHGFSSQELRFLARDENVGCQFKLHAHEAMQTDMIVVVRHGHPPRVLGRIVPG
ncbi:hypothetical protein FQZ97_221100 [compost metagenome]